MNAVNLKKEKLEIIKWVTGLKDNTAIEKLKMLRENPRKLDWWNEIADEEKTAIDKGLADIIGQLRLPLIFGLVDVITKSLCDQSPNEDKTSVTDSIVNELAGKVLEVPLFTSIQLQRLNFDIAMVYDMLGKMMQGKVQLLASAAMKVAKDYIEDLNTKCIKKQVANEVAEALRR